MKIKLLLILALFTLPTRSEALTDKAKEAAKQLVAAMIEEAAAQKPKEGEAGSGRENVKSAMIPRIQALLASPNSGQNLSETLAQLSAYFTSDAVLKSVVVLQEEIRVEKEAEDKTALANIQGVLDRAAKAVREAKVPSDLDASIAELGKNRQRADRGQISEPVRIALYQIDPILQFVTQWQNYLAAKATGNTQLAQESLRNISNSNGSSLIPRSEILALLAASKLGGPGSKDSEQPSPMDAVEKILAETKSLADVENTLKQLRKLQEAKNDYGRMEPVNALIQALQPIDKAYQEFKAGLTVTLDISQNYGNALEIGNSVVARLKLELMISVLPRYAGAPEGTRAQPGEDVQKFLDRIALEAKNRGDINVGIRAREALRLLQRGSSFSGNDTSGLAAYISGQNQEAANQHLLAVISYQTALKSGSDLIPAKVIGERLTAIQTAHPKDFEAGMDRFLNPPAQQYPGFPPGMRYPGDPRGMIDPRLERQNPPALLIPPAPVSSPTPAPSASPAATLTPEK